jgi:ferredoxin
MKTSKFLRKGRIIIAAIVLSMTFILFVDIYEWFPEKWFDSVTYLQFVPSLLHFLTVFSLLTAGGFLVVLLLTLLTGRLYCSVICPLGIFQDVITRISRWSSRKKRFFRFKKAHAVFRYSFLGIMVSAIVFGGGFIAAWLDPYSIAGKTFTYLLKPAVVWLNNMVTPVLNDAGFYAASHKNLMQPYILPTLMSFAVIAAIGSFAWKRGRVFCNTICPVGTLLGEISRFSLFKVRFNQSACTRCGMCAGVCKSECIDIKNKKVDYTRCVACFNCLDVCSESALSFSPVKLKQPRKYTPENTSENAVSTHRHDKNRRKIVVFLLAILAGKRIYALKKNKMPENQKDLLLNEKDFPVAPPGAQSIKRFNTICTGCSLCVSACPTGVLQPALTEYGLCGFMQPYMDYITNFCNFDCVKCGEVCPTGAILPLSQEEKHLTQLGKAVFVEQNCVVYTDGTDCGACSEHCPTKAVNMVPYKNGLLIPEVDDAICVGCGACEHACPVETPFKAIYVNGNAVHQMAEKPDFGEKEVIDSDEDFPF